MRKTIRLFLAGLGAAVALQPYSASCQSEFTTIVSLTNSLLQGNSPCANLIRGSDGSLYGTTQYGGTQGAGTVFKVSTTGVFTNLWSFTGGFSDGGNPNRLSTEVDGAFYGTTQFGGSNFIGLLFRITTNGEFTRVHTFTSSAEGGYAHASLLRGIDGNWYGTTIYGGSNGAGTIFRLTTNDVVTPVYSFAGGFPNGLAQDGEGNLYGMTYGGGTFNMGTIYRISTDGVMSWSISLNGTNGSLPTSALPLGNDVLPEASLVFATDGNLYGTAFAGGQDGGGTIFRIATNGSLTVLHSFQATNDGIRPLAGLAQASDGALYGTTSLGGTNNDGKGTVFRITTNGIYSLLYSFPADYAIVGGNPSGGLVEGADGNLYGTTELGGPNHGNGTVFRVALPSAVPAFQSLTWNSNAVTMIWTALAGRSYQLQSSTNLNSTNWNALGGPTVATNLTMSVTNLVGSEPQRFFRLMLLP